MGGDIVARAMMNLLVPGGLILVSAGEDRRGGLMAFKHVLLQAGFLISETKLKVPLGIFRIYECWERAPAEKVQEGSYAFSERVEGPEFGATFKYTTVTAEVPPESSENFQQSTAPPVDTP